MSIRKVSDSVNIVVTAESERLLSVVLIGAQLPIFPRPQFPAQLRLYTSTFIHFSLFHGAQTRQRRRCFCFLLSAFCFLLLFSFYMLIKLKLLYVLTLFIEISVFLNLTIFMFVPFMFGDVNLCSYSAQLRQ